ncbi:uncharacterized protein A1O5_12521 [Cladophialophora psammophila CBS 110553]|uniref:Xylanolytic transcriptional activator regulatory domain-containing protein n=1 Tax=Cladophialophora psammophila CBS 110553 TaxID=1182543 RepID=W9VZP1_9EURO|nr:uncharacterized protein A1O5_12521 [Cladophialophora psammophila CBS 110553]EXJ57731.1 hypothetical protein A1O5_12521 [Cladophialophora psammophila CBS 110553]
MNDFDPSQFNVSMSDPSMMRLDASRNSTALVLPDTNNLDLWGPARSSTDVNQGADANANNSTLNGVLDTQPPAAPLSGSTHSFSAGSAFLDTAAQSMAMPELSQAMFNDDLMFLEDFLLPEFVANATGCTTPIPADFDPAALQCLAARNEPDISEARLFLPRPTDEARAPHLFDISPQDVDRFQKDILSTRLLSNFSFPRRSRILRCLSAYFDSVDPHVPIVQQATFSLCGTAPALVLAMLGMGALITSETQFAVSAYEAACTLLDHETKDEVYASSQFEFGPIQALLLCVHFGAFSDDQTFVQRSQAQLNLVSKMLRHGLDDLSDKRAESEQDWITWSFIETFSRLASWSCSLNAVLFAYDDSFQTNTQHFLRHVPLPLDEDLWRARSAQEWSSLGGLSRSHGALNFLTLAESLLQGKPVLEQLSCFGLFSIIGWFLLYICNHERMKLLVGSLDIFETEFTSKIDVGLGAWETLTRRHLRTGHVMFRQLNPLISDSFPLLGSAYYHLYVGDELRTLKEIASKQAPAGGMPTSQTLPEFNPRPEAYKAVRYAANSWLVRAKLGISHFQQSPDAYGPHGAMGAYESDPMAQHSFCRGGSPSANQHRLQTD